MIDNEESVDYLSNQSASYSETERDESHCVKARTKFGWTFDVTHIS
jgi:hypothetical protein